MTSYQMEEIKRATTNSKMYNEMKWNRWSGVTATRDYALAVYVNITEPHTYELINIITGFNDSC